MRLSQLLGPDLKATLETDPNAIVEALEEFHPEDIAELLTDLPTDEAMTLLRTFPPEYAGQVMERLPSELQVEIIGALDQRVSIAVLSEMSADDRVDLLQELPEETATAILTQLEAAEPELAEEVRELQGYGEDTAGGLMTTEFVAMPPETPVAAAIEEVRRVSREREAETIYYIYVTAYGDKLVGVLSLRDLILADPDQPLADVMVENVVRVRVTDDQEQVADAIARYDLSAIPVVTEHGRLVGVVTVDDVVDVVIEEATEDAHMAGGVVPLEDSYFQTSFGALVGKRVIWLVVLFAGQLVTAQLLSQNQGTLAAVVSLVAFIPMIIASGGNAGAQSSSLMIRALAVREVEPGDWWRIFGRELGIGLSLGLVIAVLGFGTAMVVSRGTGDIVLWVSTTVSLSIVCVVVVGALVGALMPLALERVGLDPAVSSTPFIASVIDVVGLLVYLGIARLLLPV